MKQIAFVPVIFLALAACAPTSLVGGDPSDSTVAVPAKVYAPVPTEIVTWQPARTRPWRETNDRVRRLGGPNAHMRADSAEEDAP